MTSTCEVLGYLLNGEYFYVISLVSFLVVVALLLAALSYEQLLNIAVNTVRELSLLLLCNLCVDRRCHAQVDLPYAIPVDTTAMCAPYNGR
jgi:hypothetical protein